MMARTYSRRQAARVATGGALLVAGISCTTAARAAEVAVKTTERVSKLPTPTKGYGRQ